MNQKTFKTLDEATDFMQTLAGKEQYVVVLSEVNQEYSLQWEPRKYYTAQDGKSYPEEIWETKEGRVYQIQDMSEEHVKNCLRMIIRNNREKIALVESMVSQLKEHFESHHEFDDAEHANQPTNLLH